MPSSRVADPMTIWSSSLRLIKHPSVDQLSTLAERIRGAEVTDVLGVGDQPLPVPPVQLKGGRLHDEMVGAVGCDIEHDLMRGTRTGAGNGAAETHGDRAMQVTGDHALNLRIPRNDLLKPDR